MQNKKVTNYRSQLLLVAKHAQHGIVQKIMLGDLIKKE